MDEKILETHMIIEDVKLLKHKDPQILWVHAHNPPAELQTFVKVQAFMEMAKQLNEAVTALLNAEKEIAELKGEEFTLSPLMKSLYDYILSAVNQEGV